MFTSCQHFYSLGVEVCFTRIGKVVEEVCDSYKYLNSQEMIIGDGVSTHHPL